MLVDSSGSIVAGAGVVRRRIRGDCYYGVPLAADVKCEIFGETVFTATYQISPYSVNAPCPPKDFCP